MRLHLCIIYILHLLRENSPALLSLWLENNSPPRPHAGGKHFLVLPNNSITLDGSRSTDNQGIVSYLWIRDGQSPAAGVSILKVFNWRQNLPSLACMQAL